MGITSKIDVCNLTLGHLGNYGTINDIDTPVNDKEIIFALWYDITRQGLLTTTMPNFALARRLVAEMNDAPEFGNDNAFEYPVDCLKVLGLGNIDQRADYPYSVENVAGKKAIVTDDDWEDGMELRFIQDITDVNLMTPEFKLLLSWVLAGNVVLPITQDAAKAKLIMSAIPGKMSELSAINAQENRPIRISNSRFRASRYADIGRNSEKK